MSHERLQALTDGIFAIAMTLLVLDLKVPVVEAATNQSLWNALTENGATFLSYLISFSLLFIMWRGHNFVVSTMAKNLDANLVNLNMFNLLMVGLVPFTTHLIGAYPHTQIAIIIYALNIIFISGTMFAMREYIVRSANIEHDPRTRDQRINAYVRIWSTIVGAALAIIFSFINPVLGFAILLFSVGINLHNNTAEILRKVFKIK